MLLSGVRWRAGKTGGVEEGEEGVGTEGVEVVVVGGRG